MYHALGYGTILFIKSMMTCDRVFIESFLLFDFREIWNVQWKLYKNLAQ